MEKSIERDLGLGLIFDLDHHPVDTEALIRWARDNGWRGVGIINADRDDEQALKKTAQTYRLAWLAGKSAPLLPTDDLLSSILAYRRENHNAIFTLRLQNGALPEAAQKAIDEFSVWLHAYGHPFYEGAPTAIAQIKAPAWLMQNRRAAYQLYVYVPQGYATPLHVQGLKEKVMRAEWIDDRESLPFEQQETDCTIQTGKDAKVSTPIRVMRLLLHRPEDDLKTTRF